MNKDNFFIDIFLKTIYLFCMQVLDDADEESPSVEIIDNIANSNQDENNFDLLSDNFKPNLPIENFDNYFGSQKLKFTVS